MLFQNTCTVMMVVEFGPPPSLSVTIILPKKNKFQTRSWNNLVLQSPRAKKNLNSSMNTYFLSNHWQMQCRDQILKQLRFLNILIRSQMLHHISMGVIGQRTVFSLLGTCCCYLMVLPVCPLFYSQNLRRTRFTCKNLFFS